MPPTTTTTTSSLEGPDLNESRSPLDKKLYRQILLPNGLRAVLISDTLAMGQDFYYDDSDDDDSDDDDDEEVKGDDDDDEQMKENSNDGNKGRKNDKEDEEEDDDNSNSDDDDSAAGDDGLRDAAAAMVVGVGSMYDPPQAQGLAHFLEHMLFMGTAKYPEENAYDAFLSKHGGSDNAYTEIEYTVYHLSIPQEKLNPALDMFAQFFIDPLMKGDAVERELNSIESEFQLNKNSDQCRLQQLMCHTAGTDDLPFSKFAWGNLESLKETPEKRGVNVMELLRQFYDQYYCAQNMRLVVIGAYSLDELQKQVETSFSAIAPTARAASTSFGTLTYDKPGTWEQTFSTAMADNPLPFAPSSLPKIYRVIPVRDRHSLSVTWQIPSQVRHWESKPCDYLAHLLGHEARGSLLAALKKKSWVTGCYAGVGSEGVEFASSHALFAISFSLSEEGMQHWQAIVEEVFAYIGMLRLYLSNDGGLPEWIHEELRLTHDVGYRYGDEENPQEFVERIADRLAPHFQFPADRLLDGRDLLFGYDETLLKDLLDNYFTPSNTRVDIMSSLYGREGEYSKEETLEEPTADLPPVDLDAPFDVKTAGRPMEEPHFGTHYWPRDISPTTVKAWTVAAEPQMPKSSLALPPKNPYIPEKLDLKPLPADDSDHPLLNSSLKLCVVVGKRKSWFPATVVKYNAVNSKMLLSYEDEDSKWHLIDQKESEMTETTLVPGYEGTLDKKAIKFRLVALAKEGAGAVLKYGDESDFEVDEGSSFPAIPPASAESRLPKLICNRQELKLWHLQDRKFKRPIAELRLRLICVGANKSPLHQACADLLVSLCADAVTEVSYLASVCDLGSTISNGDLGFNLRVHGFDDKLLDLFMEIFTVLLSFRGRSGSDGLPGAIQDGRYEACHEVLMRKYENMGLKSSYLASSVRIRCICPETWSANQKSEAAKDMSIATFTTAVSEIMKAVSIEAFFHGNVGSADATAAQEAILDVLKSSGGGGLSKKNFPKEPVLQIPNKPDAQLVVCPSKNLSEANTAVEVYIQLGKDNLTDRVMTDLLTHIMAEPLYDQLRTKDQFGYSVSCDSRWTSGIMGVYFSVVSSTKSAEEITARIDTFLLDYRKELDEMKNEQFMEHLVGLAKNKLEMFNCLSEETGCYWGEIKNGRMDWEVYRNEVIELRSFTKERALAAFDNWLLPSKDGKKCNRRSLVVQVIGYGEEDAAAQGRPAVEAEAIPAYIDEKVMALQKSVGGKTWGKVY